MAESTTSRFRESLTYKLGPLPAWAWGIMLGVAVLGWQAWQRRGQPDLAAVEGEGGDSLPPSAGGSSEIVTGTASGYGDFTLSPSPMGGGTWAVAPLVDTPSATSDADTTEIETNAAWRRQATSWLIAADYTPTLANDAVAKALDGIALNAAEKAAINAVLLSLGPPPQGMPSIIDAPTPPPQPVAPVVVINPPGAVRNLRTGVVDANGVRIGWDEPASNGGASISQYITEREHEGTPGAWTQVITPATTVMQPLPPSSGRWRVRVAAQNSRGLGPWTVTNWITAWAPTPAPAPKPAPAPAPAPAPKPAPPADTIVTVTASGNDSTLWNIIRRVYGRTPTARAVSQIAAHNGLTMRGSGNSAYPSPWRAGQQIKLPPAASINW